MYPKAQYEFLTKKFPKSAKRGLFIATKKGAIMANPVGRPLKFKTPAAMQKAIDNYFAECFSEEVHPTVSGLAYQLELTTEALRNYERKTEFLGTVKRAKQRVEMAIEQSLMSGRNATGPIFNLKNNFGWKDTTQQDITTNGKDLSLNVGFE